MLSWETNEEIGRISQLCTISRCQNWSKGILQISRIRHETNSTVERQRMQTIQKTPLRENKVLILRSDEIDKRSFRAVY